MSDIELERVGMLLVTCVIRSRIMAGPYISGSHIPV
jgi:hypothetical protein